MTDLTNDIKLARDVARLLEDVQSQMSTTKRPVSICGDCASAAVAINRLCGEVERLSKARPIEEYHEDCGTVLWWTFPIEEAPYVGRDIDTDFPDYVTHWTPLPSCPKEPPQ